MSRLPPDGLRPHRASCDTGFMAATSFILRFRDLVTGTDQTIARHDEIAKAKGYAWWAWWNKSGEQPAVHMLGQLLAAPPLKVLLIDSGTAKLYSATCHGFRGDVQHRIPSPEKDRTPEYYRDETYKLWFQLSNFELVDLSNARLTLNELAYVQVDEFFEDSPSMFGAFYGKKIYDTKELIQQNRTIWFTRPATLEDPSHEIELLNAEHVRPYHFSPSRFATTSRKLLWISDLHFAKDGEHHGFPKQGTDQRADIWLALDKALRPQTENIGGLILSGDITWQAAPEEFEEARTALINRLISTYKLDPRQLVIVPGNHDIAFSNNPAEKGAEITRASDESTAAYSQFYEKIFQIAPNRFLSSGRRLLVGGSFAVDIVCLNSSLLQQHPDFLRKDTTASTAVFQGQGFLGTAQLDDATIHMKCDGERYSPVRPFRIAVLHHHVVPVTESEKATAGGSYSMVFDAERFSRWLVRHRVDLVLHGHQHQPFSVSISRTELLPRKQEEADGHTFRVLGMGSTGVCSTHLGAVGKNTFGLLEFTANGLDVKYLSVHPTDRSESLYEVTIPYGRG
jgi:UDP-2,3-diacylglucosamine pyrophosphatase LpxH